LAPLQHDPVHPESALQLAEISSRKMLPALERRNFLKPSISDGREKGHHAGIFDVVRQPAALRKSPETVKILTRQRHEVGI